MKNILVLIDFTDASQLSVNQAIDIAKVHGSQLTLCHISSSVDELEADRDRMRPYVEMTEAQGISSTIFQTNGDIEFEISTYVANNIPDLTVIATHGKHGIMQNLFGSHIYSLLKTLSGCSLVMADGLSVHRGDFRKVLIPASSHEDFLQKIKHTSVLLHPAGEIILFNVTKPGVQLDASLIENIEETKDYLEENGFKWSYVQKESEKYSIGYAHEIIEYSAKNGVDLISMLTEVSDSGIGVAKELDKENILLNKKGICILCVN